MRRLITALCLTALLAGCQTPTATEDFDASRDFAAYRSWAWQTPALQYRPDDPRVRSDLTEQRIRQAVAEQLDQRGLRPAPAGANPDLKVQAYLIVENRQQQVTTNPGGPWGYWGGPWGGTGWAETRTLDYRVATLQLDLLDGHDGKLVWRGSTEQVVTDHLTPVQRMQTIQKGVQRILGSYPPR
ncbi:DUF4136 domain-containing protein [Pseudomonas typographi]|uniref:DUF4136 domain-containing protein n=1 Tax=Pseudomonas typographi TaxID=2715964 RepID=UPI00168355A6|nr:DUF4136 domain-containing protein [Pseudomonas typographi]MBD1589418.1 DUF4136 domain-containing protein [Pseudomonas typographi]